MKELDNFRRFLTEGSLEENIFDPKKIVTKKLPDIPGVKPEVVDFLYRLQPDEVPGSWDEVNHEFVAPFEYENVDVSEENFQDDSRWMVAQDNGVTLEDLPTEYIELDNYPLDDEHRSLRARNFAKYFPGS